MALVYKPDLDEAKRRWSAFWAGEMIDRPCTRVIAPKAGTTPPPLPPGLHHPDDDLESCVRAFDNWAASVCFGGDAVPFFMPNFGPDIFAAFLGADLRFARENGTSWAKPIVSDWTSEGLRLDQPRGCWWEEALDFAALIRRIGEGKFGAAAWDIHPNLDALAALRGAENLCTDLIDRPDEVEGALDQVTRAFEAAYDGLFCASGMDDTGSSTWLPFYAEGKFAAVQCDFVCMISPEQARRFLYPYLEREVAHLDQCCYHLDGPGALVHLDDILAIERIHSIQWVPGSGNPPVIEWMDLLKKIQDFGKSLYIAATPEEVRAYHRELRPEMVFYDVWAPSQSEAESLLAWLRSNT